MKRIAFIAGILIGFHCHAGLIGSPIEVTHKFENTTYPTSIAIVENGFADIVNVYLGMGSGGRVGYTVDIDSNSILIDFYLPHLTWFSDASSGINGLYISGLELDARALIDSAKITLSSFYFDKTRLVLFDEHSVGFDFENLNVNDSSMLKLSFSQPLLIPEPSTPLLFGTGAAAIYCRRRRSS